MIFDHRNASIEILKVSKSQNESNPNAHFYSAIKFKVSLCRDPRPYLISIVIPTFIVSIYLLFCISLEDRFKRMLNVAISVLTYVGIFHQVRGLIPPLPGITILGRYVLAHLAASLIPIAFESEDYELDP